MSNKLVKNSDPIILVKEDGDYFSIDFDGTYDTVLDGLHSAISCFVHDVMIAEHNNREEPDPDVDITSDVVDTIQSVITHAICEGVAAAHETLEDENDEPVVTNFNKSIPFTPKKK